MLLILGILFIVIGVLLSIQFNLLAKDYEWVNFSSISKKDRTGKIKHYIYINGKLEKKQRTIEGWYRIKKSNV